MKIITLVVLLMFTVSAYAGTCTLTWQDSLNPPNSVTYTVYRGAGVCGSTPPMASVQSGVTAMTYADTVPMGQYCYYVTAVDRKDTTNESSASNNADAKIKPGAPTNVVLSIQ